MEDKLRMYVDNLFEETIPTRKSVELKEEMIQNLQDKYNDLISEGKTEEAAYNIAVAGIGDVSGLLAELEAGAMLEEPDMFDYETARQRSAMLTAVAVMMYILSLLPMFILDMTGNKFFGVIGGSSALVMIAAATGILVFNNMTRPKFKKKPSTIVDEFREWQSNEQDRKTLRKAISSALWPVILVLYFLISFISGWWHITWIIFLLGAAAETLINLFFTLRK